MADIALDTAIEAAADARSQLGAALGQLQELRDRVGAHERATAEWDGRLNHVLQQLAESQKREADLTRRIHDLEHSTTWQVAQAGLAPYRKLRGALAHREPGADA